MIVTVSDKAETDLEDIADWIAEDNPARAGSFVVELLARCATLSDHPKRFPEVRRTRSASIRKLTHKHYLIFYTVGPDSVTIARIVHGSRDWAAFIGDIPT